MTEWGSAEKFYDEAEAGAWEGGYAVFLDGKVVSTPAGTAVIVPKMALARALAEEWRAQTKIIAPLTMPLTRLAATVIDRVRARRADFEEIMVRFGTTDLLCYRAAAPPDLVRRQTAVWQPLVDWAGRDFSAEMRVTSGVVPVNQPAAVLENFEAAVRKLDDFELAAASSVAAATGSLVLSLALHAGHLDAQGVFGASELDESFQNELWGDDDEAVERRRQAHADIVAAETFISLYHAD